MSSKITVTAPWPLIVVVLPGDVVQVIFLESTLWNGNEDITIGMGMGIWLSAWEWGYNYWHGNEDMTIDMGVRI